MNREAKKYLFDILSSCDEIVSFVHGYSFDDYLDSPLLRRAVERDLEIIGEALVQLRVESPDTMASIPDSSKVIGMRNCLIHVYAEVDDEIVWDAATNDVPQLSRVVRIILEQ